MNMQDFEKRIQTIVRASGKNEINLFDLELLFERFSVSESEREQAMVFLKESSIQVVEEEPVDDEPIEKSEPEPVEDRTPRDPLPVEKMKSFMPESMQWIPNFLNEAYLGYTLTPRCEKVLLYRFGATDGMLHTLDETAEKFDITPERVKQIEYKAFSRYRPRDRSKLKDYLA